MVRHDSIPDREPESADSLCRQAFAKTLNRVLRTFEFKRGVPAFVCVRLRARLNAMGLDVEPFVDEFHVAPERPCL